MKTAPEAFTDLKIADSKGRVALGSRFARHRFALREQTDGSVLLVPVVVTPESRQPLTRQRLDESLAFLNELKENWDGRGSAAPVPETVAFAREALALLQAGALARGLAWTEPIIGVNERGQITLEWWREERTLTVFLRGAGEIDYLKSWGASIETEMEDGPLTRLADFLALTHWLGEDTGRQAA